MRVTVSPYEDIVHARPRAKSLALGLFVAAVALGTPALYVTRRYLERLTALAETDARGAIVGFKTSVVPQLIVIAILGGLAGLWMIREGVRAYRAQRYPQPDTWVVRDTRVRRGPQAQMVGMSLIIAGLAIAAIPFLALVMLFAFLQRHP